MLLKDRFVYIVEDNTQNRVIFQMCLLRVGARVEFERQGREAVQHLLSLRNVDIILLDLMLAKGVSGFDIYDDIRALLQFEALPIVAVSAMDAAVAVPQVRRKGFNGFIAKPIDGESFSMQVAQVLAGEQVWDAGGMNSI
jgi:CheY-like chemotaxis protein